MMRWLEIEKIRVTFERRHIRAMRKALLTHLPGVLDALRAGYGNPGEIITEKPVRDAYKRIYTDVGGWFAEMYFQKHTKRVADWNTELLQFVAANAGDRISGITSVLRQMVAGVVAESETKGWAITKTAATLRQRWRGLAESRSVTIARTEVVSASNLGGMLSAKKIAEDFDVELEKTWLARLDGRVRSAHRSANGQTVAANGKFTVGGEKLTHPGDITASPENTVNCRCAMTFRVIEN